MATFYFRHNPITYSRVVVGESVKCSNYDMSNWPKYMGAPELLGDERLRGWLGVRLG